MIAGSSFERLHFNIADHFSPNFFQKKKIMEKSPSLLPTSFKEIMKLMA